MEVDCPVRIMVSVKGSRQWRQKSGEGNEVERTMNTMKI